MKDFIKLFLIALFLVFLGCSSSNEGDDIENSFSVTIDGVDYVFDTFYANKSYDNYVVLGSNSNDENFYLSFNQNGVLERADFYSTDFSVDLYYSSLFYFPKETFNLNNIMIDTENNIVRGSLDGTIYEDESNLISNSLTINQGAFNLVYTSMTQNFDIYVDATINGERFESIKHSISENQSSDMVYGGISDNELTLAITTNRQSVQPGSYSFSNSNQTNSFAIYYINPYNDTFENYNVSGTLVVDEVVSGSQTIVTGSFSGIATNELGETFTITDGIYNLVY